VLVVVHQHYVGLLVGGSVLGPILFILFVIDIVRCMADNVLVKLVADDAQIYRYS